LCLYLMGLNLSNLQIAAELDRVFPARVHGAEIFSVAGEFFQSGHRCSRLQGPPGLDQCSKDKRGLVSVP
jgi:hypothetical protein